MKSSGFNGISKLYANNDKFCLIICFPKKFPSFVQDTFPPDDDSARFSFMSDYCDLYFAEPLAKEYIKEHWNLLIGEGAVEILAQKFG